MELDILNVITEQTTSIALAIVIMWFYNKLVLDFLAERKEMIEALRAERKEWLETSSRYLNQLFEASRYSIEAINSVRTELYTLRELLLKQTKKE